MIAFRPLLRRLLPPRPASLISLVHNIKFRFSNASPNPQPEPSPDFSHQKGEQEQFVYLTSPETLAKFSELMSQSSVPALEEAAELLAKLEFLVEKNEKTLYQFETVLNKCEPAVKSLIQRMQMIRDNIRLQNQELESIQVRAQKQISQCKNYSISAIAKEVLEVADALSRSRKMCLQSYKDDNHQVLRALTQADKQMKAIFQVYGIQQFDPTDSVYDPNRQEALSTMPAPSEGLKNRVAGTIRTGYTIKGRLLRSAHVSIYV